MNISDIVKIFISDAVLVRKSDVMISATHYFDYNNETRTTTKSSYKLGNFARITNYTFYKVEFIESIELIENTDYGCLFKIVTSDPKDYVLINVFI